MVSGTRLVHVSPAYFLCYHGAITGFVPGSSGAREVF